MRDYGRYIPSGDGPDERPRRRRPRARKGSARAALYELGRKVARAEQLLGEIGDDMTLIMEQIDREGVDGPCDPGWRGPGGNAPGGGASEPLGGVKHVGIERNTDGSAEVSLKGYPKIHLSKVLVDLLELLCEDGDESPDNKVAWKTRDYLQKRLTRPGCKPLTTSAVTTNINRLRNALEKVVGHRRHIETDRRFGYRFARLKSPPDSWDIF